MKILHYINNLGPGGAEKLLTDILPLMCKEGNTVHLLSSNRRKNIPSYDEILEEGGILIKSLNMALYNPLQVLRLIKILKTEQYDIVHSHLFPTQYWLAIASLFKPKATILYKTEHNVYNKRRKHIILKPIEKWMYNRYDTTIAITQSVKQSLQRWISRSDNIVVIKNGINLQQMKYMKAVIAESEYSFLSAKDYNILMVGSFTDQKDQSTLVRALLHLPERYKLYLAGRGENEKIVKQLVNDLGLTGRVNFLGVRTDVYKLMSLMDLNVLSSNYEGLSGVALESMASGRPFIGTDVDGINNVVPNNRFLFPRKDIRKLASIIYEISTNSGFEEELITYGLDHVKKFDIGIMVHCYLEAYRADKE